MEIQVKRKKIMLVDDDADLSELVKIRLESAGFEVNYCANGQRALDSVDEERPDAIILDMEMPEKNGYTTLLELNKKFNTSGQDNASAKIPIIVMTGLSGTTIKDLVQSAGIYDFVRKPFSVSMLVDKINKALEQKG
jgi:DNA-binding response OmpR family regulator